jgi:hypothetical protein
VNPNTFYSPACVDPVLQNNKALSRAEEGVWVQFHAHSMEEECVVGLDFNTHNRVPNNCWTANVPLEALVGQDRAEQISSEINS